MVRSGMVSVPVRAHLACNTLQTTPLIRRIRRYARSVVCQRDQCMSSKQNLIEITVIQLAIDIDLPTCTAVLVQLRGILKRRELLPPNLKEVAKGVYMACWSL